jgi:hypothetical protein
MVADDDPPDDFENKPTEVERPALDDAAPTPKPIVETTGRHNILTPAQFASAVDLTDRNAYERGVQHGRAAAQAELMTELSSRREDDMETLRSLWVIFDIQPGSLTAPDWKTAEAWLRRRFTPL